MKVVGGGAGVALKFGVAFRLLRGVVGRLQSLCGNLQTSRIKEGFEVGQEDRAPAE